MSTVHSDPQLIRSRSLHLPPPPLRSPRGATGACDTSLGVPTAHARGTPSPSPPGSDKSPPIRQNPTSVPGVFPLWVYSGANPRLASRRQVPRTFPPPVTPLGKCASIPTHSLPPRPQTPPSEGPSATPAPGTATPAPPAPLDPALSRPCPEHSLAVTSNLGFGETPPPCSFPPMLRGSGAQIGLQCFRPVWHVTFLC